MSDSSPDSSNIRFVHPGAPVLPPGAADPLKRMVIAALARHNGQVELHNPIGAILDPPATDGADDLDETHDSCQVPPTSISTNQPISPPRSTGPAVAAPREPGWSETHLRKDAA